MPIPFTENIRNKMCRVAALYELFNMKQYMTVQSEVLQNVARHFGISEIRNLNSFLASPQGQFAMKAYRNVLLNKYGSDEANKNNPNTDKDIGFYGDQSSRDKLVQELTSDILVLYNKEHTNA
jgi:hypothetical protein